ncbi:ketopantoate reductase family protein [Oleomonas cavernae]|nr:2-dehydropantoate 2-reductase N-terminal domain-containing protein [Oleomonas cavernae]
MKILIIGAGAVGQVYALHLSKAGHDVSFFAKRKYAGELRAGLTLHRLRRGGHATERLQGFGIVTSPEAVAAGTWDQVWITLSSDALRGELAGQVLAAVGMATVITLQPTMADGQFVHGIVPPAQIVHGSVPFISFQSPLPGCDGPNGMAYFLPPLRPTMLAGPSARVAPAIAALRRGGLRARRVRDLDRAVAVNIAMGQALIPTLEANQWRLSGLSGTPALAHGLAAAREAVAAVAAETGASTLFLKPLLTPLAWRLLLPVAPCLVPFNLETFLRYHFSKLGAQTQVVIDGYIDLSIKHSLPADALVALRRALPQPS